MSCEICAFRNPKCCVTAIILRENKLLVLKRNEEPFKGAWDLPGGYVGEGEVPEAAMRREIQEELNCRPLSMTLMRIEAGTAHWQDQTFPIVSHFYLVDIGDQSIRLNEENSAFDWSDLQTIDPQEIAFDSNENIVHYLKDAFRFDLSRVRELVHQLDQSAEVKEQTLYLALLEGHIITEYDGDKLIGMGWLFPRQTMLRRQAVVEDMIVDEAYRGQKLGKKIMEGLIQWAKENRIEVLELTTNPKRVAANELYKNVGFKLHETNHYLLNLT